MAMRIKELRQEKGKTMVWLAAKVGICYETLKNWERGRCFPNAYYLPLLAEALDCFIEDLFVREGQ